MVTYFISTIVMAFYKNPWSITISLLLTLLFLSVMLTMVIYDQMAFSINYAVSEEEHEIKKMLTK